MNPNLEPAIIEFLANEFHVLAETLSLDTNFRSDFGLNPEEVSDLLQRIQDALNFIIPDEKISEIETVGDLVNALTPDKEDASLEDKFI